MGAVDPRVPAPVPPPEGEYLAVAEWPRLREAITPDGATQPCLEITWILCDHPVLLTDCYYYPAEMHIPLVLTKNGNLDRRKGANREVTSLWEAARVSRPWIRCDMGSFYGAWLRVTVRHVPDGRGGTGLRVTGYRPIENRSGN
jgi:hypothetical protein